MADEDVQEVAPEDIDEEGDEPEKLVCPHCGWVSPSGRPRSLTAHMNLQCPVLVSAEKRAEATRAAVPLTKKSRRGMEMRGQPYELPDVVEQIPTGKGQRTPVMEGSYAYFLNPRGATINEALVRHPNGGGDGTRYGKNAALYRQTMVERGFEYVGQVFTEASIKRLVEVVEQNRPDYILFLQEEMDQANFSINEGFLDPEIAAKQRRRVGQLTQQLRIAQQEIDPSYMIAKLTEVAEAQALARAFSPEQLNVLRAMIGSVVKESVGERAANWVQERDSHRPTVPAAASGTQSNEIQHPALTGQSDF